MLHFVHVPQGQVHVVQKGRFTATVPTDFEMLEVLAITEKAVESLKRIRRVRIEVGDTADHVEVIVQVSAQRKTQPLIRNGYGCRTGRKREVEETGPRAGQHVDIHVVGHIDKSADEH